MSDRKIIRRRWIAGPLLIAGLLFVLGLAAACSGGDVDQAELDAVQQQLTAAQQELTAAQREVAEHKAAEPTTQTIVQVGQPVGQAAPPAAPSGWDTEFSQLMGVKLLETFDSNGPQLFDPVAHPVVYMASEGPGYGGLTAADVTLPGYQVIDAKTKEVLAAPHFNIGPSAAENKDTHDVTGQFFEPHGLGVSPDGQFVYIPTAAGTSFGGAPEAGRMIVVNATTGRIAQVLQVPGRPHHIKSFVDSQGNDRVLAYSWNWGAYIFDPKDQNRVVGAVPNGILNGRGYLAFVDPSGKWLFYTVRPPRGVEAQGTVAVVNTETWEKEVSIGIKDSSPIFVAFDARGETAYVTGGHESIVAKIDMSEEEPGDWEMVKFARAGTEGPYGLNLNWTDDLIVTIGKGEGSHNKGITVGLVDPRMIGSARPLGEVFTGCLRADHGILNPDPEANELWISCNSSFETVVFDLSKSETRGEFSPSGYVKQRIPSPNGGSTHNGAFVQYSPDFTGEVLADQNGLHGTALQTKIELVNRAASAK